MSFTCDIEKIDKSKTYCNCSECLLPSRDANILPRSLILPTAFICILLRFLLFLLMAQVLPYYLQQPPAESIRHRQTVRYTTWKVHDLESYPKDAERDAESSGHETLASPSTASALAATAVTSV
jgi:hypothetical protein